MKRISGLYNVITPEFCELQIENAARMMRKNSLKKKEEERQNEVYTT